MGGRHESPKPGTDLFMAVVILVLMAILAAVVIPPSSVGEMTGDPCAGAAAGNRAHGATRFAYPHRLPATSWRAGLT